mgnify:CR=1 FL=1|tara:strand:+ start:1685 stop:2566 length:882 start_codon:yes stop_codon:yes gene_type:complete
MKTIKFAGLGWDGYTGQISRIREGIKELGHTLDLENPDLIYCNDPTQYINAIKLKRKYPKSFLILNFLDVPWHMPSVIKKLTLEATIMKKEADMVTVISNKVKNDLSKFYDGEIEVIYNPVKDVELNKEISKSNNYLYVGRANDPIKRVKLIHEAFKEDKITLNGIIFCGFENPKFGNYLGVVKDKKLSELYNLSKFVLLPSKAEGIGLSMIEGMICGSVPIMCSDNLTAKEFAPNDFICDPNHISFKKKIEEIDSNYEKFRDLAISYGEKYKVQFNKKEIAKNIINTYNKKT